MKSFLLFILTSSILSSLLSCTIYRSPQRKDFESDAPTFQVQNLKQVSCSNTSLRTQAEAYRLVTVLKPQNESETEDNFLYEYIVNNTSHFESDNLKGVYCAFEKR